MKKISLKIIGCLIIILTTITTNVNVSNANDLYHFTLDYFGDSEVYENQLPDKIELKLNLTKDKNHDSSIFEHIVINDSNQILEIINILKNCQCEPNGIHNDTLGNQIVIKCHYDELNYTSKTDNQVQTIQDTYLVCELLLSKNVNCMIIPSGRNSDINLAIIDDSINNLFKFFKSDGINSNLIYDPIESTSNIDDVTITNPNVLENNNATSIISEQIPAQTKDNENASQRNDNSVQSDDKIDNETNYKESITNETTIHNKNIINYIIIFIILFLIIVFCKLINKIKK